MPSEQSARIEPTAPTVSINLGQQFQFGPTVLQPNVPIVTGSDGSKTPKAIAVTSLDALDKFKGTFAGFGFNTIFRPNSTNTQTIAKLDNQPLDKEIDNLLQLNLTAETMVFAEPLGNVPNRGLLGQADIQLNGVPYTQTIVDAMPTKEKEIPVIHFEPGLWMRVPKVQKSPLLPASYCRMASIPHGTTIHAQCFEEAKTTSGAPKFNKVSILPLQINPNDQKEIPLGQAFQNQNVMNDNTRRLPQPLGPFTKDGTITQDILNNPNLILEQANKGKDIIDNTTFTVSTEAPANSFGGGTSNIGFNVGGDKSTKVQSTNRSDIGNANAAKVKAFYWISTVRAEVQIPAGKVGEKKIVVSPAAKGPRDAVPTIVIDEDVPTATTLKFKYNQIQYSQDVSLDFFGLRWPHITVATLAPTGLLFSELKKGN